MNRIRLEINSGVENNTDYYTQSIQTNTPSTWSNNKYATVNDDSDPYNINWSGFQFSSLDAKITQLVQPLQTKIAANGEKLHVNLCYVGKGSGQTYITADPQEYAEFVEATVLHMQQTFGFVPDTWEVILEPDHIAPTYWPNGSVVAKAILAAAARLQADGITGIKFVGPSDTAILNAITYFQAMVAFDPTVVNYMQELSFHGYQLSGGGNTQIGQLGAQYHLQTSMLEKDDINANEHYLYQMLTVANISAFQQYAIAGPYGGVNDGTSYYYVNTSNPANITIVPKVETYVLRQYMKPIRAGAVRIDAISNNVNYESTAFINANGKYVVEVNVPSAGSSFSVTGLPAGTYKITYGSSSALTSGTISTPTITSGQSVSATAPYMGVVTLVQQ